MSAVRSPLFPLAVLSMLAAARPAVAQGSTEHRPTETTISFEFAGGSLASFLEALRQGSKPALNIVAPMVVDDIVLPRVSLQNAPVLDALQAVAMVAPPEFEVRATRSDGDGGSPVYTVLVKSRAKAAGSAAGAQEVRVFSIRMLTASPADGSVPMKAETVLSALEAAGRVQGKPIDLSYHETSGLLFVRGTAEQLALVGEVLSALDRDRRELAKARSATVGGAAKGEAATKPDAK